MFKGAHRRVGFVILAALQLLVFSGNIFGVRGVQSANPGYAAAYLSAEEIRSNIQEMAFSGLAEEMENSSALGSSDILSSGNGVLLSQAPVFTRAINGRLRSDINVYVAKSGDTLGAISRKFGITTDTIMWANNLDDPSALKIGQKLTILPVSGVLHRVTKEDTVGRIARKYKANAAKLIAFNDLETREIEKGMLLIVPDGVKAIKRKVTPFLRLNLGWGSSNWSNVQYLGTFYNSSGKFAGGWCTSYVSMKKNNNIPWLGDAKEWAHNASAKGVPTGYSPKAGAIYVEPWLTSNGHVSLVEKVNSDGSFVITEGNARFGYGTVDRRQVPAGRGGVFIYW